MAARAPDELEVPARLALHIEDARFARFHVDQAADVVVLRILLAGQRFHGDIQGSKLIVYLGVGHVPMEELPDQSSRDAAAFLAAL